MSRKIKLDLKRNPIKVVAGILHKNTEEVLLSSRNLEKKFNSCWEFPGGKVESGESKRHALKRELFEELGISVIYSSFFCNLKYDYEEFDVDVDFFLVTEWSGEITGLEGQKTQWVRISDLNKINILPSNTEVIKLLRKF